MMKQHRITRNRGQNVLKIKVLTIVITEVISRQKKIGSSSMQKDGIMHIEVLTMQIQLCCIFSFSSPRALWNKVANESV